MRSTAALRLARISNHLRPHSTAIPNSSISSPPRPAQSKDSRWIDPKTYRYWLPVQTRWSDNDSYGHMNNAYYYHLFDTVVNRFLLEECREDVPSMGLVVHSSCTYCAPVGFPLPVVVGLAAEQVGRSSVQWRVSLWPADKDTLQRDDRLGCAAYGTFVHVYVDRETRKSVEMSEAVRAGAMRLLIEPEKTVD